MRADTADPAALPLPRDRRRERARAGPGDAGAQPLQLLDHFFVAVLLRREVQFMAKSQLFRPPVLDFILNHGGTFPVRRGKRDEEAFITAHTIFDRGGMVLMYARGRALAHARSSGSRSRASAGSRSSPACRWSRWRSTAPSTCARPRAVRFPKVTMQYGSARHVRRGRAPSHASSRRRSLSRSSTACARCTRRSPARAAGACWRASARERRGRATGRRG